MRIAVVVFVLSCIACALAVTNVQRCPEGRSIEDQRATVTVGRCKKGPCKLKKGRIINVEIKFTADRTVDKLTHNVQAIIVGIPFPFIGVDGTDSCPFIYESDGQTKAGCPLQAGKEYVYKHNFEVLQLYPNLRLVVHWGLTAGDGKDISCWQTKARIVN